MIAIIITTTTTTALATREKEKATLFRLHEPKLKAVTTPQIRKVGGRVGEAEAGARQV